MKQNSSDDQQPHYFPLGPFRVLCRPMFYEIYTRYTILANGVPIRDQISYPDIMDGWYGLTFTRTGEDLTPEQKQLLSEFNPTTRFIK